MTATLDDEVADLRRANAKLQRRLDEALAQRDEGEAQKTAMAEILEIINSSPGELSPVFDEMLEKATRLCEAVFGILVTVDGERIEVVAQRNLPERLLEFLTRQPMRLDPATIVGRAILERRVVHTLDNAIADAYLQRAPLAVAAVEFGSIRTILHVPLIKDAGVIGVFIVSGRRSGHFRTSRSRCCKTSPRRRSSRWRTRGS
jgi:GAF domain-containing protein